jgi:ribosomal protein L11 methyltransferase
MSWQTITLRVPEALKDTLVGEFSAEAIAGVWERLGEDGTSVEMVFYFEGGLPPRAEARIGRLFERNGCKPPAVAVGLQGVEDWSREWRKGFTSFTVGERFHVVPSWEEPSSGSGDRIVLGIDPGMAFGTGTHETTALMLEALEALGPGLGPESVILDLGTGTAILAMAATGLGLSRVFGCDTDADAVEVARGNLNANRSRATLFVGSADAVATGSVDVLLANLTAEVIRELLMEVDRVLAPHATAVFSGILDEQAPDLATHIRKSGYRVAPARSRGEWVMMVARRDD